MLVKNPIRVLLIDDDEDDFLVLRDLLSEIRTQKFLIEWAPTYEEGLVALNRGPHDVGFLDYRLGAKTGLDFLHELNPAVHKTPLILLTGYGEHEVDLETMKYGAADYLIKDQITPLILERSIRYAIHRAQAIETILNREAQILVQDRLASIGLLASSLAHEIGTPLGVIRGRAEYLEMQTANNPAIKKNVSIIISQIDRVTKLIRSLLELARGAKAKESENILVDDVVKDVLELMNHEFKKHCINVQNEVYKLQLRIPSETGSLQQVLLNLIVNSIHAIVEAKVKLNRKGPHSIRIDLKENEQEWILVVKDSGCGISPSNMKNLFKPFFTLKELGIGTGLGLATSYRITQSWGGAISAKSWEGLGSEFNVFLPKSNISIL